MAQYWVVGATFEQGKDDQFEAFVRGGYWCLGRTEKDDRPTPKAPTQLGLRRRMLPGDRIAIKKRLGNGSNTMKIRALGIITKVDQDEEHRVDVDWLLTHLDRDDVPLHGCAPAINGPYTLDDDDGWLLRVFYI